MSAKSGTSTLNRGNPPSKRPFHGRLLEPLMKKHALLCSWTDHSSLSPSWAWETSLNRARCSRATTATEVVCLAASRKSQTAPLQKACSTTAAVRMSRPPLEKEAPSSISTLDVALRLPLTCKSDAKQSKLRTLASLQTSQAWMTARASSRRASKTQSTRPSPNKTETSLSRWSQKNRKIRLRQTMYSKTRTEAALEAAVAAIRGSKVSSQMTRLTSLMTHPLATLGLKELLPKIKLTSMKMNATTTTLMSRAATRLVSGTVPCKASKIKTKLPLVNPISERIDLAWLLTHSVHFVRRVSTLFERLQPTTAGLRAVQTAIE